MGKKVLVADDSLTIQKVIKLALSSEGYDILAVSGGKEAVRAIHEERPDVVLIDVSLPGQDAYAVKRDVNSDPTLAKTGFVLLTSAFERVDEKQVDEVRFHARLVKPFDPSHLRKTVSELMAESGEDPVSEEELRLESIPTLEAARTELSIAREPVLVPPPPPVEPLHAKERTEPAFSVADAAENDIKDLTESTIKMSGLDELEWNLDDSRRLKKTSSPPAKPPLPRPEVTKELPRQELPRKSIDDGGSNFPIHGLPPTHPPAPQPPLGSSLVSGRDYVAPTIELRDTAEAVPGPSPSPPQSLPMTRAEMEELIRQDLAKTLEKIANDVVPRLAEQILRSEIEKLLAEP